MVPCVFARRLSDRVYYDTRMYRNRLGFYCAIRSTVLVEWVLVRCTRQTVGRHSLRLQPELCRQIPTFWRLLIHMDCFLPLVSARTIWFRFSYSLLFMAVHAPIPFFSNAIHRDHRLFVKREVQNCLFGVILQWLNKREYSRMNRAAGNEKIPTAKGSLRSPHIGERLLIND